MTCRVTFTRTYSITLADLGLPETEDLLRHRADIARLACEWFNQDCDEPNPAKYAEIQTSFEE